MVDKQRPLSVSSSVLRVWDDKIKIPLFNYFDNSKAYGIKWECIGHKMCSIFLYNSFLKNFCSDKYIASHVYCEHRITIGLHIKCEYSYLILTKMAIILFLFWKKEDLNASYIFLKLFIYILIPTPSFMKICYSRCYEHTGGHSIHCIYLSL